LCIRKLTPEELAQLGTAYPALNDLLGIASEKLKYLLLNIFNLHLLAELLNDGVLSTELEDIRTQPELLDAYWRHRVHGDDGKRDAREGILLSAVEGMIASRALQVARLRLRNDANIGALNELERQGVLVASEANGRPDDDILLFAHNILFDYAVARLVFRRGREPTYLVSLLLETPELTLLLGPSLSLAMTDRWGANRNEFWNLALALERERAILEIARLQAPMVIAEDGSVGIEDLEPLLTALSSSTGAEAAEAFLQHLIGAVFVLAMTGRSLVGPGAGPWSILAEHLTAFKRDRLAYAASPLVSKLIEQIDTATAEQLHSLGEASGALLTCAWEHQPRQSRFITTALHATCITIASNVQVTAQLLRQALQPAHMEQFAYEELRHITRNIDRIIDADAKLAGDIYDAAFSFDERSDATTNMSDSQLLGLRSNRRQDYQGSWYELTESYPKFLKAAPEDAARSLNKSMEGYVARTHFHNSRSEEERTTAFDLGGCAGTYVEDYSYIWLQTAISPRQDAPQLIVKLGDELSSEDGEAADRLRRVISTLMDNARLAVMWRTVLDLAARKPPIAERFAATIAQQITAGRWGSAAPLPTPSLWRHANKSEQRSPSSEWSRRCLSVIARRCAAGIRRSCSRAFLEWTQARLSEGRPSDEVTRTTSSPARAFRTRGTTSTWPRLWASSCRGRCCGLVYIRYLREIRSFGRQRFRPRIAP
jgi:hypothetical protein